MKAILGLLKPLSAFQASILQAHFFLLVPLVRLEMPQSWHARSAPPSEFNLFAGAQNNPASEIAETLVRKSIEAYGGNLRIASFRNATFEYKVESQGDPLRNPFK